MRTSTIALLGLLLTGCAAPEEDAAAPETPAAESTPAADTPTAAESTPPPFDPAAAEPTDTAGFIPPMRDSVRQGPIIELPPAPDGPPGSRTDP